MLVVSSTPLLGCPIALAYNLRDAVSSISPSGGGNLVLSPKPKWLIGLCCLKLLPPSLQLEFQSHLYRTGCGEMEADNKSSKIKGSMKRGG